jgi:putative hemolysin
MMKILFALAAFAGGSDPASQLCVSLGGSLEEAGGKPPVLNCVLEEWTLFRAMSARHLVRPISCPRDTPCMPNPAARNCADIGGGYRVVRTPQGEDGYCVMESWALYRVFSRGWGVEIRTR